MIVGNMGSERKMNYTIMGNAVNMASRLEGVNKRYGTRILAGEETIRETRGEFLTRRLARVRVVGANTPVQLYEILDFAESAAPETEELAKLFNGALEIFESRDWTAAEAAFEGVLNHNPEDKAARIFRDHCVAFRQNPPEAEWDGVINLSEK
jgi:hypothetical protein